MPRRSRPAEPSGPMWRTAPGRSAASAVDERPAQADTEPETEVVAEERPARRPSWLADAQHAPPRSLGRPAYESPAFANPAFANPPVANPTDRVDGTDGDEVDPAAARRATARAATARAAAARATGWTSSPPPEPAAPPEHAAGSELAAPQVRLDQDLPRSGSQGTAGVAVAGGNGHGTLARYSPERDLFSRSIRSLEPISDLEAAAFAGRFAADFQSFDEDDPGNRAEVLRPLLADSRASTWGWSGAGRQRADSPLPGRIFRTSDTVVFVEVIVRATTYARVHPQPAAGEAPARVDAEPIGLVGPSSAPPESDPRWVAAGANWLRMTVPVTRSPDDGRLVVDPHLVPDQSV